MGLKTILIEFLTVLRKLSPTGNSTSYSGMAKVAIEFWSPWVLYNVIFFTIGMTAFDFYNEMILT